MRIFTKINCWGVKQILSILLFLVSFTGNAQSARSLDSILASLDNRGLYIAPIIYSSCIYCSAGTKITEVNKDSVRINKRLFMVSSFDENLREMAKKYSDKVLILKLYALLLDTERDLYANALLCDLFDNRKLGKLLGIKREDWVTSGRQKCDMEFWKTYLNSRGFVNDDKPVNYY